LRCAAPCNEKSIIPGYKDYGALQLEASEDYSHTSNIYKNCAGANLQFVPHVHILEITVLSLIADQRQLRWFDIAVLCTFYMDHADYLGAMCPFQRQRRAIFVAWRL
jgi:hypothetical protein